MGDVLEGLLGDPVPRSSTGIGDSSESKRRHEDEDADAGPDPFRIPGSSSVHGPGPGQRRRGSRVRLRWPPPRLLIPLLGRIREWIRRLRIFASQLRRLRIHPRRARSRLAVRSVLLGRLLPLPSPAGLRMLRAGCLRLRNLHRVRYLRVSPVSSILSSTALGAPPALDLSAPLRIHRIPLCGDDSPSSSKLERLDLRPRPAPDIRLRPDVCVRSDVHLPGPGILPDEAGFGGLPTDSPAVCHAPARNRPEGWDGVQGGGPRAGGANGRDHGRGQERVVPGRTSGSRRGPCVGTLPGARRTSERLVPSFRFPRTEGPSDRPGR